MNVSFLPRWYVLPHLRTPAKRKGHDIISAVQREFGLDRDTLTSNSRSRRIVRARQIAWYSMSRNCPHISYPQMARMLGRSDHSTAIHGVHVVQNMVNRDAEFSAMVDRIERDAFGG